MINLLPKEIKENLTYAKTNRSILRVLLYTFCLIGFIGCLYTYQYIVLNNDLNTAKHEYNMKYASLGEDKVTTEAQKLSSRIATAATLLKREIKFSRFIKLVGTLMPDGAYLSNLNVTNDTKQPLQIDAVVLTESQGLIIKKNIDEVTDSKGKKIFIGADIQSITATKMVINNKEVQRYIVRITTAFNDSATISLVSVPHSFSIAYSLPIGKSKS